jgi:hypothetical protein
MKSMFNVKHLLSMYYIFITVITFLVHIRSYILYVLLMLI